MNSIHLGASVYNAATCSTHNLGVVFDSNLSFSEQINSICRSVHYYRCMRVCLCQTVCTVRMYVCMYVNFRIGLCLHACMHLYIFICVSVCLDVFLFVFMFQCPYSCVRMHAFMCALLYFELGAVICIQCTRLDNYEKGISAFDIKFYWVLVPGPARHFVLANFSTSRDFILV